MEINTKMIFTSKPFDTPWLWCKTIAMVFTLYICIIKKTIFLCQICAKQLLIFPIAFEKITFSKEMLIVMRKPQNVLILYHFALTCRCEMLLNIIAFL